MLISQESVEALELPSFLQLVAEGAATDAGRQEVLSLAPSSDAEVIAAAVNRGLEMARLLDDGVVVPLLEEPLLPLLADLVERRTSIEGKHLVRVRELLQVTLAASRRIERADPPATALAELSGPLPELSSLAKRLAETLEVRRCGRGRTRYSRNTLETTVTSWPRTPFLITTTGLLFSSAPARREGSPDWCMAVPARGRVSTSSHSKLWMQTTSCVLFATKRKPREAGF
jgi:hypothetical protein